jgi:hypothetical protein
VARVEVSLDGGATWSAADLDSPEDDRRWAWRRWRFGWQAEPGAYVLLCRATAVDGETQPLEGPWNRGGFGNNGGQVVNLTCIEADADVP